MSFGFTRTNMLSPIDFTVDRRNKASEDRQWQNVLTSIYSMVVDEAFANLPLFLESAKHPEALHLPGSSSRSCFSWKLIVDPSFMASLKFLFAKYCTIFTIVRSLITSTHRKMESTIFNLFVTIMFNLIIPHPIFASFILSFILSICPAFHALHRQKYQSCEMERIQQVSFVIFLPLYFVIISSLTPCFVPLLQRSAHYSVFKALPMQLTAFIFYLEVDPPRKVGTLYLRFPHSHNY